MSLDAGFRHRSGRAQGASCIQSVELTAPNMQGRRTVVHDLVSFTRRCTAKVPLSVICAFVRDKKRCPVHGTEEEYQAKLAAGGPGADEVLRLNCYSSGATRLPPAAQVAEGIGANIICLRTQLDGFWVTTISHDQDAHIGHIFRGFFGALECFDGSHIAVRSYFCSIYVGSPKLSCRVG